MKPLLFLLGIFLCLNANAQRVTYNDLVFVLNNSTGDAIEYLLAKGFNYTGSDTAVTAPFYVSFHFSKNKDSDLSYMGITKTSLNGIFYEVSFFTTYKSDYLKFKEYLKKIGFNKTETTPHDSTITEVYLNMKQFKKFLECDIDITHDNEHNYSYYSIFIEDIKKHYSAKAIKDYMYNQ